MAITPNSFPGPSYAAIARPIATVSSHTGKRTRVYKRKVTASAPDSVSPLAITDASHAVMAPTLPLSGDGFAQNTTGTNQKQKNSGVISTPRSADPAEAAEQPR